MKVAKILTQVSVALLSIVYWMQTVLGGWERKDDNMGQEEEHDSQGLEMGLPKYKTLTL